MSADERSTSVHYVILDDRPERISRLRFLLHLRGIEALLAMNAAEVLNWRSACREADAELHGVILYFEAGNIPQLKALESAGFDLPVYAVRSDQRDWSGGCTGIDLVSGSIDEILQKLPANRAAENDQATRMGIRSAS